MSHSFSINCTVGQSNYISLAPFANNSNTQSAVIYRAGHVRVSLAGLSVGTTAANGLIALVRPVTFESAPSNPGPSMLSPGTPGTPVNSTVLSTRSGQTALELGQPYQKGFSVDAQGKAVATHLLCEALVADSDGNCWLDIEVD